MTNFEADSSHRITFILAGQPELATMLQYSHFDALRARIRLSHTLVAMTLEETIGYIDHGIARAINSLCYRAILAGAIDQKQVIDTADIAQEAG